MRVVVVNEIVGFLKSGQIVTAAPTIDKDGQLDFWIYIRPGYWQKYSSHHFAPAT